MINEHSKTLEFIIPNDTDYLSKIRKAVKDLGIEAGFSNDEVAQIILSVDEAIANVMEHAYGEDPNIKPEDAKIVLKFDINSKRFQISIQDFGREFNPLKIALPDLDQHIKTRKNHGLGVYIMRQLMDEITHTYEKDSGNILNIVKYIQ